MYIYDNIQVYFVTRLVEHTCPITILSLYISTTLTNTTNGGEVVKV
jgi:hypothetical protein